VQLISFYLAALGFTIERDGWRFEPVKELTTNMRCRGQCSPTSKEVVYEIFVDEVIAGPHPTVIVDLLASVDGLKAFHAHRLGVELVPDWPLSRYPAELSKDKSTQTVAKIGDLKLDYHALLSAAWGQPTHAFGEFYGRYDAGERVARLPGPPYHFMTRILELNGEPGAMRAGINLEAEYDVPPDAWYFSENDKPTMPLCVLMEAALQPCGWLASYAGCSLQITEEAFFRNLDGTGTQFHEVRPDAGSLRTRTTLKSLSRLGNMFLVTFDVTTMQQDKIIFSMNTGFGFFTKDAFVNQAGLPKNEVHQALIEKPSNIDVDLTKHPDQFFNHPLHLANKMLLMIDKITGYWSKGDEKKLAQVRAEKIVNSKEWFFKAHFYQDPVQPGSIGIQALLQLLQFYMLQENLQAGMKNPKFEPIALDKKLTWKYRGQVVPKNHLIEATLDVIDQGRDEKGVYAIAQASLWVDKKRIYQVDHLAMRIIDEG
jgi:3-hydroxymyristoyl/3-hydroxydecanoyl-(acyl carrier protein) dehydratase